MPEYCVCEHPESEHWREPYEFFVGIHGENSYCFKCKTVPKVHKFKLDNLKLIEDLAKERGLV